jgi:hypothetical protein
MCRVARCHQAAQTDQWQRWWEARPVKVVRGIGFGHYSPLAAIVDDMQYAVLEFGAGGAGGGDGVLVLGAI